MKTTILILLSLAVLSFRTYKSIDISANCTDYLKRAADANTVEIAKQELGKTISYLEANNILEGNTSIIWNTPDEDVTFWYNNLKSSYKELEAVTSSTNTIERTNLLMKLRESLIDHHETGEAITIPTGLARYPYNGFWAIFTFLSASSLVLCGLNIYAKSANNKEDKIPNK